MKISKSSKGQKGSIFVLQIFFVNTVQEKVPL